MNAPHEQAVAAAVQSAAPTLETLASTYLDAYRGRDESRYQRISTWVRLMGSKVFAEITPEDIDVAMATLASEPAKVYSGKDADGSPIFRRKSGQRSGATLNRYLVALAALFTWARKARFVPRGFESPTRHVEKHQESRGRVRYLKNDEREALLATSRESAWPRLYLLVLMAMTTGARRGELPMTLRGLKVVLSPTVSSGKALLLDNAHIELLVAEDLTIEIGTDADDFTRNVRTILGEMRVIPTFRATGAARLITPKA
jgi:hypothetical protein